MLLSFCLPGMTNKHGPTMFGCHELLVYIIMYKKKCGQSLSILWCSILTPTCLNIFLFQDIESFVYSFVIQYCYRHHQHGRWQARIGRVAGNKDLDLGTFSEYIYNSISPSSKMTKTFVMDCFSFFFLQAPRRKQQRSMTLLPLSSNIWMRWLTLTWVDMMLIAS